jgi:hypothetical protein
MKSRELITIILGMNERERGTRVTENGHGVKIDGKNRG